MSGISDFDNEPDEVPPAPSRPANETQQPRILGMPADVFAQGIQREIDALFTAQREALKHLSDNFGAFKTEITAGMNRIYEALKAIERHEVMLRDDRHDINALDGKHNALRDQVDRDVGDLKKRVDRLERSQRPTRARKRK